jgi:hypothetical protein
MSRPAVVLRVNDRGRLLRPVMTPDPKHHMRKPPDDDAPPPSPPRWVQRLIDLPQGYYLFAFVGVAALIIAFVLWLDERTLALVAGGCFLGMLVLWAVRVRREWRDSETSERVIAVLGVLMLLGAAAANLVRYLLLG